MEIEARLEVEDDVLEPTDLVVEAEEDVVKRLADVALLLASRLAWAEEEDSLFHGLNALIAGELADAATPAFSGKWDDNLLRRPATHDEIVFLAKAVDTASSRVAMLGGHDPVSEKIKAVADELIGQIDLWYRPEEDVA